MNRKDPPGPKGSLLLANLAAIQQDSLDFLRYTHAAYGDILRYRIAFWTVYRLCHPDHMKWVLQDNQRNYSKDSVDYQILARVAGNGLITSQGDFWLRQRRLMQPAFHRRRIGNLVGQMVTIIDRHLGAWAEKTAVLNISQATTNLTLDIASQTLLSLDLNAQGTAFQDAFGVINHFFGELDPLFALAPWLPTPAIRRYNRALRQLNKIVYGIIAQRRLQAQEPPDDMLTLLLEATDADTGEQMTDKQLRDELITLLIAGHETSANSLAWLFYLVAQHPAVEARLLAEVETVLVAENGAARLPTLADLPRLVYTTQVIKETLRLYPPAWFLSRTAVSDDKIDGYDIPAGSMLSLSPYLLHRYAEFWPDPNQFDPERFTPDQEKARHRFAYIPFGSGPRKCIGSDFAMTELTLIVAMTMQRVRLTLNNHPQPQPKAQITLGMVNDLLLAVEPR